MRPSFHAPSSQSPDSRYVKGDLGIIAVGLACMALVFFGVRGCSVARADELAARVSRCVDGRHWEACADCSRIEARSADVCRQIMAQLSQEKGKTK